MLGHVYNVQSISTMCDHCYNVCLCLQFSEVFTLFDQNFIIVIFPMFNYVCNFLLLSKCSVMSTMFDLILSGIHDHANAHCFMKVLDGEIQETLYGWPVEGVENEKMDVLRKNVYGINKVAYINGKLNIPEHV